MSLRSDPPSGTWRHTLSARCWSIEPERRGREEGSEEEGREGGRKGGREGGREGGRKGGRKGGREGGREEGREDRMDVVTPCGMHRMFCTTHVVHNLHDRYRVFT